MKEGSSHIALVFQRETVDPSTFRNILLLGVAAGVLIPALGWEQED